MEWQQGQKVGVFLHTYTGPKNVTLATIVKVGKTRVTLDNGDQYTLQGLKVGSDRWTSTHIMAWDDTVQRLYERSQIAKRHAQLRACIESVDWRNVSIEDLEAVTAVLAERGLANKGTAGAIARIAVKAN